ncbi:hypothetical protein RRG08_055057 [Elysia crispata]|uniref:Uncharacterized protein n=1 Tax=Elysia crispata TaxID=231223 RepID=A0AAE1B147_9GAST|nr:hypothetical protein RRG08_055057 [Elysia crispata]
MARRLWRYLTLRRRGLHDMTGRPDYILTGLRDLIENKQEDNSAAWQPPNVSHASKHPQAEKTDGNTQIWWSLVKWSSRLNGAWFPYTDRCPSLRTNSAKFYKCMVTEADRHRLRFVSAAAALSGDDSSSRPPLIPGELTQAEHTIQGGDYSCRHRDQTAGTEYEIRLPCQSLPLAVRRMLKYADSSDSITRILVKSTETTWIRDSIKDRSW